MLFESFHDAVSDLFSSYNQAQPFRQGRYDQETRTPQYTRELLDRMGAPDRTQHNIKVTGSKGKGSTSRLIARLLEELGLKVGLFTSPHLVDFTERIRVNGVAISEEEWLRWQTHLYPELESIRRGMKPHEYFGPVGLVACIAALYFQYQGTDVNVFELGRGARFDDVNRVVGELAVITPVQLEHPDLLGPELKDIAWNKAGIIQPGMKAAISARQVAVAHREIQEEADRHAVALESLGRDFSFENVKTGLEGTTYDLTTRFARYESVRISLLGRNQVENASVAIVAVEKWLGHAIHQEVIRSAFAGLWWPGRIQWLRRRPHVLIDGAINKESAGYLREVVSFFSSINKALVVGVPVDKDGFGVIRELAPGMTAIWVTQARKNPHLVFDLQWLEKEAERYAPTHVLTELADALLAAEGAVGGEGLVIVAGTQSLVAEALAFYRVPTRNLSTR